MKLKISRASLGRAAAAGGVLLRDLICLLGCAAFLHGAYLIYPPAAWLLGGAGAAAAAFVLALPRKT